MTLVRQRSLRPLLTVFLAVLTFSVSYSAQTTWRSISPSDLASTESVVEPNADAEGLFWEITLDDKKSSKLIYSHYVRIKIFTDKGREQFSKMDIFYSKGRRIEAVAARVIKPDGSTVELKAADIFDREIVKAGKVKVNAKSFAVPGIEPGVIVEYQYTESVKNDSASGERLIFQRNLPIQRVTYFIRPYRGAILRSTFYNMPHVNFVRRDDGFLVATVNNVKAFREEPYMPPSDEVMQWAYISYDSWINKLQWVFTASRWNAVMQKMSKPNKEVTAKAKELTQGSLSDDEKLRRIYEFVQTKIRNANFDRDLSEEAVEKLKIKDADDALRKGVGYALHIDLLFASLAKAAGFEVNLVLASDRSDLIFNPDKYPFPTLLKPSSIAIQVGNKWRYFNPGTPYLPFESLIWQEENTLSMIVGADRHSWRTPPVKPFSESPEQRTGKFKLLSDGTLEGTATIAFGGHQAISRRRQEYRDSQQTRETNFKEEFRRNISSATITDLKIENFDDNTKPLVYVFNLRIPDYAQIVGKRMFVQPNVFTYGSMPYFSSTVRNYPISFPYPWSEEDDVTIELPKDFNIDAAETPKGARDKSNLAQLSFSMKIDETGRRVTFNRKLYFGANGHLQFPKEQYPALKMLFDIFHKNDTQAISLIQKANLN